MQRLEYRHIDITKTPEPDKFQYAKVSPNQDMVISSHGAMLDTVAQEVMRLPCEEGVGGSFQLKLAYLRSIQAHGILSSFLSSSA